MMTTSKPPGRRPLSSERFAKWGNMILSVEGLIYITLFVVAGAVAIYHLL